MPVLAREGQEKLMFKRFSAASSKDRETFISLTVRMMWWVSVLGVSDVPITW